MGRSSAVFVLLIGLIYCETFTLPVLFFGDGFVDENTTLTPIMIAARQAQSAIKMAVADVNNDAALLPNIELKVDFRFYGSGSFVHAITEMIDASENNETLVLGNLVDEEVIQTGIVGGVYGVSQLSVSASSSLLSNKESYPYLSRVIASADDQVFVMRDTMLHFQAESGKGWTDIAIMGSTSASGVDLASSLITKVSDTITVLAYQQFLEDVPGLSDTVNSFIELSSIKDSGARVIVFIGFGSAWENIINQADEIGLVGEGYVWIVSDGVVGIPFTDDPDSNVAQLSRGLLGQFFHIPQDSPEFLDFVTRWGTSGLPGSDDAPFPYTFLMYDMITMAARAVERVNEMNLLFNSKRIPPEVWTDVIREISFDGVSGPVVLNSIGDRVSKYQVMNFIPETVSWNPFAIWSPPNEFEMFNDVVWSSNTTDIPDLDIREGFKFWSCHKGEKGFDETGKTIQLHTPDGSDIDDIDINYHCDHFIDCQNFSDERIDCGENYLVLFIVFGIVTGILICIALFLLVTVLIFGIYFRYPRYQASSPVFLILLLLSVIVGYFSVFAWFGKPHPVACAFQPWLLGLPILSMITSLGVKTFRLWRIFMSPLKRVSISNLELFGLWALVMTPAVLIVALWTLISTPTAKMENVGGEDHYVCATGGFTGEPGGIVFFTIFLAYGALILLAGAFLSVATRKVPSSYNESSLIAISIYNLCFLSVVIFPVFLILRVYNPFLAWIIRTIAILYAITATTFLQFAPKLFGIVFVDRFQMSRSITGVSTMES